ncbi:hypothetical protein QBC34DRAFT_411065 [Podospora aff. communis PSN243]|uniref:GIY-YIG domain-containing protein n=1 Tax=Podospora aff. communis PSN243 TaxID=3040156 RepID=A0AAV9GI11_9PEZI|nr:hypothetical protein QBC34DRAFT_411065 [Podospora aff. communis PSN243]
MAIQTKPIPALYTVYILRSTVRHASLYIGSTPNPPRRLSQHNGVSKGGAARTSKGNLRPWEMVGLVSGFPSMVAALKFEWALTNPHLSLHIPSSSRLTVVTGTTKRGRRRRPTKTIVSIISNIHLLLRVPSFSRWPLRLHFFAPEVHATWKKWCSTASEPLRESLVVVTDFGQATVTKPKKAAPKPPTEDTEGETTGDSAMEDAEPPWGIHALPLDYEPIKEYVVKSQNIFEFEQEGNCVVCREAIVSGEGLHAICTNDGCVGVGHLSCWSRHFLPGADTEGDGNILPIQGQCPKCKGDVQWGDMMKELTLRTRGQKDVEKLLKTKRKRATKPKASQKASQDV